MSALEEASARALAGGPERHREKAREQGKLGVRERIALLLDDGSFAEEALLANWQHDGLGADGVVIGVGTIEGRPVALMANDPTVKAGSWGPEDGREDPAHPGARAQLERAAGLPRRLGGRAHHRAGADVSGTPRRRPHLPQPGEAFGRRPAGVRPVRAERGGRRVHPGVLRHRDHARGQRVDVPRLAADGRDGDRREGDASRRWAARACTRASRAAGTSSSSPTRRGSTTARRYLSYLPGSWRQQPPSAASTAPATVPDGQSDRRADPGRREQAIRHEGADRGARRRGLDARDPSALGEGADRRLRAPGRRGRRDRRKPAEAQGRRAVRRLGRQGGALHLDLQRVQRAAAVPRRRARLHDRHPGRARRHHPARREDDQRSQRGDRSEDLGRRAQGLWRGAVRDGRPCVRARLLPGAAERVDRGDGPAGGDQRRLLQPAAGDRRRARSARGERRSCARSTPRTSTSCTSPPSS